MDGSEGTDTASIFSARPSSPSASADRALHSVRSSETDWMTSPAFADVAKISRRSGANALMSRCGGHRSDLLGDRKPSDRDRRSSRPLRRRSRPARRRSRPFGWQNDFESGLPVLRADVRLFASERVGERRERHQHWKPLLAPRHGSLATPKDRHGSFVSSNYEQGHTHWPRFH